MSTVRISYGDRPDALFSTSPALSILIAAQRSGAQLRHDCGGKAMCGTCRVKLVSGSLSPMSEREGSRLRAIGAEEGTRLACQSRAGSDVHLIAILPPIGAL